MANEPVQITALLSVFADDGEFTLRVDGSELAKILTPQVTRMIGESATARKLTLLTPTDTKIFKFTPPAGVNDPPAPQLPTEVIHAVPNPAPRARERVIQDFSAPPAPEVAAEDIDEFDQTLKDQQKAEQEMRLAEKMVKSDPQLPVEESPVPAVRKRTAKERPTPTTVAACGRCTGQGVIDGGGACPVCRGQGSIPHFGRGGRR